MTFPFPLLGYIDPSSGSLAIQFLIAAAVGAGVVMREYVFWPLRWAMRLVRGNRQVKSDAGH